jgi:hypothetical protein
MKNQIKILFIFLFLAFSSYCNARQFHSIMVVDTTCNIGYFTAQDLKHVRMEGQRIAKLTNMQLNEKIFAANTFNRQMLLDYLQKANITPEDTVLFYFSGHGYRTYSKDTMWPVLSFGHTQQGVDLYSVAKLIKSRNPRFALILADCCNNFIEQPYPNGGPTGGLWMHDNPPYAQGYQSLFHNSKGMVVISSSRPGQFSYGCEIGGFYTNYFLMSLNEELYCANPNWEHILQRASEYVRSTVGNQQQPQYHICN